MRRLGLLAEGMLLVAAAGCGITYVEGPRGGAAMRITGPGGGSVTLVDAPGPGGLVIAAKAPPPLRREVRGRAPSLRHVWIPGHWEWRAGAFVWVGGRWSLAPRSGAAWVPATWTKGPGGWTFAPGHWR